MKDKIVDLVIKNLKNPKLYTGIFVVIIIVLLLFPYIDANYFYYNRVEKRIEILNEMTELDGDKVNQNEIMKDEYYSILSEISKQKTGSLSSVFITDSTSTESKFKFLSGGFLTWILAFMCIFIKFEKKWYKFMGFIVLGIIGAFFGYISMLLPTVINPRCNYFIMPVFQFVLLALFVTSSKNN